MNTATLMNSTDSDADSTRAARIEQWTQERLDGATYREIGEKYSISHERVRQVLKKAGAPDVPRNYVANRRRQQLAEEVTVWLVAHGPTPVDVIHREFDLTSQRLTDLVNDYGVPKEYIMAGENKKAVSLTFDDVTAAARAAYTRLLEEEPGAPGLSVSAYDRVRIPTEPSPALITSRFGWKNVCDAAGVPTGGRARPDYNVKWTDQDLLTWIGRYTETVIASGGKITFDGYDQWRRDIEDAPSGALIRTRLRRAGYPSWAAMVNAGTKA